MADKLKLTLAVLFLVGGIGGFYYFGGKPEIVQWGVLLAAAAIAVATASQTVAGRATWEFAKGARVELRKVVWPTRKETMQMTLVVFVLVVLIALFIWVLDWVLHKTITVITG
jgi:preprotein translocase subunit SecE